MQIIWCSLKKIFGGGQYKAVHKDNCFGSAATVRCRPPNVTHDISQTLDWSHIVLKRRIFTSLYPHIRGHIIETESLDVALGDHVVDHVCLCSSKAIIIDTQTHIVYAWRSEKSIKAAVGDLGHFIDRIGASFPPGTAHEKNRKNDDAPPYDSTHVAHRVERLDFDTRDGNIGIQELVYFLVGHVVKSRLKRLGCSCEVEVAWVVHSHSHSHTHASCHNLHFGHLHVTRIHVHPVSCIHFQMLLNKPRMQTVSVSTQFNSSISSISSILGHY